MADKKCEFIVESNEGKPVVSRDPIFIHTLPDIRTGKVQEIEVGEILFHENGGVTFVLNAVARNGHRLNVILNEDGEMITLGKLT